MSTTAPALDSIRRAMQSTNDLFNTEVFGNRNFGALDDVYTADARILPPGAPMISGRESIKAFWTNMIQAANAKSAVLESVEVIPAGDGVVEIGRAVLTIEPQGAPAQIEAKYVVHWKQEDGRWKWNVDIWNANE
jgi:ketosteroid isomerase-like protein